MRRNVMLGEIFNVIYKNSELSEEECKDLTHLVLDEIEEHGMLPPEITIDDGDYYLKNVNIWEPENEEK